MRIKPNDDIKNNVISYDDYVNLRQNNIFLTRTIYNDEVEDTIKDDEPEKLNIDHKSVESSLIILNNPIHNGKCEQPRVHKKFR